MTHLQDKTKEHGIRCNRWTRGYARVTENVAEVNCSTCLGKKRAPNRYQSVDISHLNLVGKILHKSWGYNMTINTYYLITKQNARSVVAHEICSKVVEDTGYMSGREVPVPEMRKEPRGSDEKAEYTFIVKGTPEHMSFIGGQFSHSKYNHLWENEPNYFNHCD